MKGKDFVTAIWALDWDSIQSNPDSCVQGVPSFDEVTGVSIDVPFGEILRDRNGIVFPDSSDLPTSARWLYGFSQDGKWLAAYDAVSSGTDYSLPGGSHQRISASALLSGKSRFDPDKPVEKMLLSIEGLREWFGEAPITMTLSGEDCGSLDIHADTKSADNNVVLFNDERFRIELIHSFNRSDLSVAGVDVTHDCQLSIEFKKPYSLQEVERIAFDLEGFFSFCCCFYAGLQRIQVKFEEAPRYADLYLPLVEGKRPSDRQLAFLPLTYRWFDGSIETSLTAWMNADDALKACFSLLTSLLFRSWKLPVDLRFIAASQLLEAVSKYGTELKATPVDEYETYRDALKNAIKSIRNKEIRRWAMGRLPGNQKGQKRLLIELLDRNPAARDWLFPSAEVFVSKHIAARNYYTHRNGNSDQDVLTQADLHWHTECILLFCYVVIAGLIGLEASSVTQVLQKTAFMSGARWHGRKLYSKSDADRS